MVDEQVTVLHLSDLQFGKNHRFAGIDLAGLENPYDSLLDRLWADLETLKNDHGVVPALLIVTGDLAEWAMPDEFRAVREFLEKLTDKAHLNLPRERVAIVPGNHDVNRKACQAHFLDCESEGREPVAPWWPKWKHYAAMFQEFYREVPAVEFSVSEPWTLFEIQELKVVIAGLNSTMTEGHDSAMPSKEPGTNLPRHVGWLGEPQLRWFAERFRRLREQGWLRIGAVHHNYQRGCKDDDENLEDADELKRVLGPELNLLLHGHTHEGDLGWIARSVPVLATGSAALKKEALPAELPNQYQMIQLSPNRLVRYSRAYFPDKKSFGPDARTGKNNGVAQETLELSDVRGTFPQSSMSVQRHPDDALPRRHYRKGGFSVDEMFDVHVERDQILDRVAELCRLRNPESVVTPYQPKPEHIGYLRVTEKSGTIARTYPVGICSAPLTMTELEGFISYVDATYRSSDSGLVSEIVYCGDRPSDELLRDAERRRVKIQSFVEYQGLIDFSSYVRKQTSRLERDEIYPPRLYVPQRMRWHFEREEQQSENALLQIEKWLLEPKPRFVLILGDFGTGKTFLLHELARRMGCNGTGLTPLFVELRALEKAQTLEALVAQHLAKSGEELIDLTAFRYMLDQGRLVVFFDGFDELAQRVSYERAAEHFDTLVQAAGGNAKVVVTSRTQHFESEQQVRTVLYDRAKPLPGLRYCRLHSFTEKQIGEFLRNRWADAADPESEAAVWLQLIHSVKDLLGLSENPRVLGFITELDKQELIKAQENSGRISAAELYRLLVERWLGFEYERAHPRGSQVSLSHEARMAAVTALALRLWDKTERYVTTAEIAEIAARTVVTSMTQPPPPEIGAHLIGSGSLLRRDDEGCFSFVHQSVLEWLVAREAASQLQHSGDSRLLGTRALSQLMTDFLCDLAEHPRVTDWARAIATGSRPGTDLAVGNAFGILQRLGVQLALNLTNQDLRGRDFGNQLLAEADLSGADLSYARLPGQDLSRANLSGAKLLRADLTCAILTGANLAEADLSEARLAGADLRDADLTGAILHRSVLLKAVLDNRALMPNLCLGAAMPDASAALPAVNSAGSSCNCVVWDPVLGLLASGHDDNSVRIWDPKRGLQLAELKGHSDAVMSLAFSQDGLLASASDDNTVRIWDPKTGLQLTELKGHSDAVKSVAFSQNGLLASGSADRTVRIWDPKRGLQLAKLNGHTDAVWSVTFSQDGLLASGSADRTVRIWDPKRGLQLAKLKGHSAYVKSVAFSPDGLLASGSGDNTLRIWDAKRHVQLTELKGHSAPVWSVSFSQDGLLASGSADNTVRIWDPKEGLQLAELKGHSANVLGVAFSKYGLLASGGDDRTVRIWDAKRRLQLVELKGRSDYVMSVAFSQGGLLASGSADRTVRIWDPKRGSQLAELNGHSDYVMSAAFSEDGLIASGSGDRTVRIWDAKQGLQLARLNGHSDSVWSVAFSQDGMLASGSADRTVRIWDPKRGLQLFELKGHSAYVMSVAFSQDGMLASGSGDNTVRIWDPKQGSQLFELKGHSASVWSVAFSQDGLLASGSDDNTVRIWAPKAGLQLAELKGHSSSVRSVAFSPDGLLASGSDDNTVRIWDPKRGLRLAELKGHSAYVMSVAFSHDGLLASGSADNTVRIWDPASGRCLAVLAAFPEGWVAFTLDGRYKYQGNLGQYFWHRISLCRFDAGELDEFIPGLRMDPDEPMFGALT